MSTFIYGLASENGSIYSRDWSQGSHLISSFPYKPIPGRESEMVPSSGGQGYAFRADFFKQFKRWLVFGSTGSTMYASAQDSTVANLEIVKQCLYLDYKQTIDMLIDASVNNLVPKQTPMLVALAMALSYEDRTVRIYDQAGVLKHVFELPKPVDSIGLYEDETFHVGFWLYDRDKGSGHHYVDMTIHDGETVKKSKPEWLKLYREINYDLRVRLPLAKDRGYVGIAGEQVDKPNFVVYSHKVREYAREAARKMIRQSSQLFELVMYTSQQRGWGSILKGVAQDFYEGLTNQELSLQVVKYGQRHGFTHKDMLRLVKPVPTIVHTGEGWQADSDRTKIYAWAVGKFNALENVTPNRDLDESGYVSDPLSKLWAFESARAASSAREVAQLIVDYQLPREVVERADTKWLKEVVVWDALLEKMPAVAMVRNLRTMGEIGLLEPFSDAERHVVGKLLDKKFMKKVHPAQIIQAALMYDPKFTSISDGTRGRSQGDRKDYKVSRSIIDALNDAFDASFGNLQPTGKNILSGTDVSGSMWCSSDRYCFSTPRDN